MARDCIPLATGSYDLKSPCLRYEYTTGSPARGIRPKLDDLLQRNLIGQLLKFSSKDRGKLVGKRTPEDLRRDISDVDFDPPEGWDYLDETIPELYKAWESKGRVDEEDYY